MKAKDVTLTPLGLINSLGEFDLDPCGFEGHNTAKNIYLLPEKDGLKDNWFGKVWMNPPYSEVIKWVKRMSEHNNGIALVLASTETRWFQDYVFKKASGILFLRKRPKFMNSNYEKVALMRGVVLVSYGEDCFNMLKRCNLDGYLIKLESSAFTSKENNK
jgi:hypothetical protein